MTNPTREQLDRYMDLVVDGNDPEDAILVVFGEPAKPKKPTVMVTEFPDGVVVGWDHCTSANGGCGRSVSKCECKGGPKELKVFAQWRDGSKQMPDYAAAAKQAKAAGVPTTEAIPTTEVGVVVATQESIGQVKCATHNDFVDRSEAELNDDGTWTCFLCQESGAQRG